MGRKRITVRDCDVCQSTEDVRTVRIMMTDERNRSADLCPDHRRPLVLFIQKLDKWQGARPIPIRQMDVMTMDEVAQAAATARRSEASQRGAAGRAPGAPLRAVEGQGGVTG